MKIKLSEDKVEYINNKGEVNFVNLGSNDIKNKTFESVDIIVMNIIEHIASDEEVTITPSTLESKMIARKIEDRIKREVVLE